MAVVKKFGDDQGGNLTTLLAWNAFFELLPLLLVLVTLLSYFLRRDPTLQQRVLHSALADFPIQGTQLQQNVHSLRANGVGLVVGIAGSLWGARGITQAGQYAMAELWNIPRHPASQLLGPSGPRPGPAGVRARAGRDHPGHRVGKPRQPLGRLPRGQPRRRRVNVGMFLAGFRVLTPRQIPARRLVAGAVVAGISWQALLANGGYLVGHNLRHATAVYGFFAVVLGLLSWLYLGQRVTLYAAEVNVVMARRLWTRSLLPPPLTGPDQQTLTDLAKQEERPRSRSRSASPARATTPTATTRLPGGR